jgi:hypothetical protein
MSSVESGEGRTEAQGSGRTTTEGNDMTHRQIILERLAVKCFTMLMMRLGVKQK